MVLVHGIWMKGFEWLPLARRLRRAGYEVDIFRYPSLTCAPAENAVRLERFIAEDGGARVHLVAHSLGGILVLHLLARYPDLPQGRVVLIGAPVAGSEVARRLHAFAPGRWLLGRSIDDGLLGGAPGWGGGRDLGVIAGDLPVGAGWTVGGLPSPNDGTVAVDETRIDGMTDFRVFHASHLGLLFDDRALAAVVGFLSNGLFPADSRPARK